MSVRVCHFTSVHDSNDGRIFERECRSLAEVGYEVWLVAPNAKQEILDGVHIVGIPWRRKNRIFRFFILTHRVFKMALSIDADVYHFHDPELLPFGLKLKKKGKKVIFDSHEFYGLQLLTKQYIISFLRRPVSLLYSHYESYVCRRLDAVVEVCTVNSVDYFKDKCRKTVFITNASDSSVLLASTDIPFEKRNNVICYGTLAYERGVTSLVQASKYTDAVILLAGWFFPEGYYDDIKKEFNNQNVKFVGLLTKCKTQEIFDTCFAGIATLLNKGQYYSIDTFPTKIYDYMSSGIPVIMSDSRYNIRQNEKYHFGICVKPDNPIEIAMAINFLKNNPLIARQMGENGRDAYKREFNWKIQRTKLVDLYAYVMKN